jgi:hypothetical protein
MADESTARTQAEIDALLAVDQSMAVDGVQVSKRSIRDRIDLEKHEQRKGGARFGFGRAVMIPPEH